MTIGAALLLALSGMAKPAAACSAGSPQVSITPDFPEPSYDYRYPARSLTRYQTIENHEGMMRGSRVLGLTVTDGNNSWKLVYGLSRMPDGTVCGSVRAVAVTIGWRSIRVYVARELWPEACLRNRVVFHENTHVAMHQRALRQGEAWIAAAAGGEVTAVGRSASAVEAQMQAEETARLDRAFQAFGALDRQLNAAWDREDFNKILYVCGGRYMQIESGIPR